MIDKLSKEECCGCEACVQVCPQECISLSLDNEGFNYPKIDYHSCTRCNICEKVCSSDSCNILDKPEHVSIFAAINCSEDIRYQSSSGGVFYELAYYVINQLNGAVYGAAFTSTWNVNHIRIDKIKDIYQLQKSKYLQSKIKDIYIQVQNDLRKGIAVLFSGTPCQAKALNLFLKKDYSNLYIIDVACHGVPSEKIWKIYLQSININISEIEKIDFRDKDAAWHNYTLSLYKKQNENTNRIVFERCDQNPFMKGFIYNLYNRPSCHCCPAKDFTSGSDLMLADYWGIEKHYPEMDDNRGTSLVICKTEKGNKLISAIENKLKIIPTDYQSISERKDTFFQSSKPHYKRNGFIRTVTPSKFSYKVSNYLKHSYPLEKRIIRLLQCMLKF